MSMSWGLTSPAKVKAHKTLKMAILGQGTREVLEMNHFSSVHFLSWKNVSYETQFVVYRSYLCIQFAPLRFLSRQGTWAVKLRPEGVEVEGCPPHPSLLQMLGLRALDQGIGNVSFLPSFFFSFLFFFYL